MKYENFKLFMQEQTQKKMLNLIKLKYIKYLECKIILEY